MKPLFSVALIVLVTCAGPSARAQKFRDEIPDASEQAYRWPAPTQPWEINPPLAALPHGDLWQDYTGGGKHGMYAARGHIHIRHLTPARTILTAVCCWLDKLVARPCRPPMQALCTTNAPATNELLSPLPAPVPVPLALPIPIPLPERSLLRSAPDERVENFSPQSEAGSKSPSAESEEPRAERPGVVELAPDFVFPEERTTPVAPRNRIPERSSPPRNAIPAQ